MRNALRVGLAGLSLAMVLGAAPAFAGPANDGVTTTGTCSMASTWKLKASPDNGRLEVDFEVDSNVVGQTWSVMLKDNGAKIFRGTATTQGPSGSFEVRKITADRAGTDSIQGLARNAASGETCMGSLSI